MRDDIEAKAVPPRRRILVVDDVPANLVAMEAVLTPLACELLTAESGEQALAHLLDHDVACVLMDVQMPGMDGFETASLIRARPRSRHTPIIFITAHDRSQAAMLRGYRMGAIDFLYKPIEPEILIAKASVLLALQDQAEAVALERRRVEHEQVARQHAEQLRHAQNEYTGRMDAFLAILSHELRNPLAPIRTAIDLVKNDPDKRLGGRVLQVIDRQSNMLAQLIDDLMDVSRIKANKLELRRERLDLRDVIEAAVLATRSLRHRTHEIVVELPGDPVFVLGDSVRLDQVFANLLDNAAVYSDPGSRIDIRCTTDRDSVTVEVRDSGVGIPAALIERIFDMFVQERAETDGSGGLGIGLALARQLTEMHDGTIRAHSDGRGTGSTFVVRLPLHPALLKSSVSMRLVLIHANEDERTLLAAMLETLGHEVQTASDGATGLDLVRNARPEVALIDLDGLDGFSLGQALRDDPSRLDTRLIGLSAYGQRSDIARSRAVGFDEHLVTPASPTSITTMLEKLRVLRERQP